MAKSVKITSEWEWLLSKPPLFINSPFLEESIWKKWTSKAKQHACNLDYQQKRLGHHYEDLIAELLISQGPKVSFKRNLQIKKNKRTTGEIDFLITDGEEQLHLEVAVKFYLYDPPSKSLISPSGKEHWREKRHKLINHQLRTGIEIDPTIKHSKAWIQGIVFTPLGFKESLEIENINPQGQRGTWLYENQWTKVSKYFEKGGYVAQYHRDRWGEIPEERWNHSKSIEEKIEDVKKGLSPYLWLVTFNKSKLFIVVHSSWPD